jgi:hypothetical protein
MNKEEASLLLSTNFYFLFFPGLQERFAPITVDKSKRKRDDHDFIPSMVKG